MKPVQFILAMLLALIGMLYFIRIRSHLLDRILVLLFGLLGLSMVVAPDWTNSVANLVGVGRGADLFIYLAILGFAFVYLLFYAKVRDLEATLTEVARAVALEHALPKLGAATRPGTLPAAKKHS
jgi:hypothetical protein